MATAFGPGIRALSVYNTTDGTTIQIDGADISPESTIEESKTTRTSAKGNVSKLMTVWELNVQFADPSGFSSLNSADSQTREWQVVAAGVNGKNLQWYEDSTFIVENSIETDPAADSNYPYTLRMRHISESPAIYNNVNLLAYLGWEDADSDGVADGYSLSGATGSFSSGEQTINFVDATSIDFVKPQFAFPISGIGLTFSQMYPKGSSSLSPQMRLRIRNFSQSTIDTSTENLNDTSDVERISFSPTPAATFYIFPELVIGTSTGAANVKIAYPALTTNGTLTPSDSFLGY